jgi:prepilin peptidase CpaA
MAIWVITIVGLTACIWDLRTHRIPNLLTFGAIAAGLVVRFATAGWIGAAYSITGCAVGIGLLFPFFVLRGMGAGDVKLLGAFGAWLGPVQIVHVAIATALIGALTALAVVIKRGRGRRMAIRLSSMAYFWSVEGLRPVPGITLSEPTRLAISYSLPITAGALVTILLRS